MGAIGSSGCLQLPHKLIGLLIAALLAANLVLYPLSKHGRQLEVLSEASRGNNKRLASLEGFDLKRIAARAAADHERIAGLEKLIAQQRRVSPQPTSINDQRPTNAERGVFFPVRPAAARRAPCLIYHHIPKTAGRTIQKWMEQEYGFGCVGAYKNLNNKWGFGDAALLCGHWTPSLPNPRKCATMTILRDPVQRVMSALKFHGHDLSRAHALLGTDQAHPRTCCVYEYNNDMVRFLSGHSNWDHYNPDYLTPFQLNSTHLERAKTNLKKETIVCTTSTLESCVQQIRAKLSLVGVSKAPLVSTPKRYAIDESFRALIEEANQWDIELYDYFLSQPV